MTIGLDLSSLQNAHRMRGIGYTLINFINNISSELRLQHSFVFYFYLEKDEINPLDVLDLKGLTYEVRPLERPKSAEKHQHGKLSLPKRTFNKILGIAELHKGDSRLKNVDDIDVFLQTDQSLALPRGGFKKAFIAYDVIPYVLEWDYLWSYGTARTRGFRRRSALSCALNRWLYVHRLNISSRKADKIISISDATRDDFLKYTSAPTNKIVTVHLGINTVMSFNANSRPAMHRFVHSSWGYLKRDYRFDDTPFLLFVGGADKRRKLDELVTAFNHLRARGHNIKLVLAGDSMQGPLNISTISIQQSLQESSYIDDIIFMGFVDDEQRDWLYGNALCFIFPSMYEGFGLPVLEAFSYGCPVITYPNKATVEVAGSAALYANSSLEILAQVESLLAIGKKDLGVLKNEGVKKAEKLSWRRSSSEILEVLDSV